MTRLTGEILVYWCCFTLMLLATYMKPFWRLIPILIVLIAIIKLIKGYNRK